MSIVIEIKAPDISNLADAIHVLASAIAYKKSTNEDKLTELSRAQATTPTTPQAAPTAVPITPAAPPAAPAAPAAAPPASAVPTAAQEYTLDQLAVAATQLVDAGRRTDLVNLLTAFGVQALTALPKEQYGNFATKLREMGAKI